MNLEELRKLAEEFFEWPTEDRMQVTLTSALLFAQHVLRMAAPGGEAVFKLHPDASSEKGDLVTIGKDESTGFREFTGPLGVRVGDFSYPLYRKFTDPAPAVDDGVLDFLQFVADECDDERFPAKARKLLAAMAKKGARR